VADLVYLDPWRIGICPICFGWYALFATKIQFASAGIFSSFGPSVCRSMSYPFWVICSCALRLHSDDQLCLNQVCWLVAPETKRRQRASQASREGGCGVAGWQGLKMDSGDIVDLMPRFTRRPSGVHDNAFSRRGGWWGFARQDDLRYVIIKSKAVSLICICSCYFLAWSRFGPIRVLFYVLGLGLSKPNSFLAVYIRRLGG
jgi:hypothetical protein